jgi:hypothetical protein
MREGKELRSTDRRDWSISSFGHEFDYPTPMAGAA